MFRINHSSHFCTLGLPCTAVGELQWLSQLQQFWVPLMFPLLDVVVFMIAIPSSWTFCFHGSGLPLSFCSTWTGSIWNVHMVLWELKAAALVLYWVDFHLSDNIVASHLDDSTAKAYLCKKGGKVSPFLFRLACCILNLADKHGVTYSSLHTNLSPCGSW